MAPRLRLLKSSESKKKEPKYACLSEATASHSCWMWTEVSSPVPHLLHEGLLVNPSKYRFLLWVLCPVRRPITTVDCVLLKDNVSCCRHTPEDGTPWRFLWIAGLSWFWRTSLYFSLFMNIKLSRSDSFYTFCTIFMVFIWCMSNECT